MNAEMVWYGVPWDPNVMRVVVDSIDSRILNDHREMNGGHQCVCNAVRFGSQVLNRIERHVCCLYKGGGGRGGTVGFEGAISGLDVWNGVWLTFCCHGYGLWVLCTGYDHWDFARSSANGWLPKNPMTGTWY